jgi:excisionase family DNA binding protein
VPGTLRTLVARRQIPFGKVGRLIRFPWPTVQRWVEHGGGDVAAGSSTSPPPPELEHGGGR